MHQETHAQLLHQFATVTHLEHGFSASQALDMHLATTTAAAAAGTYMPRLRGAELRIEHLQENGAATSADDHDIAAGDCHLIKPDVQVSDTTAGRRHWC
jgi:hypothetical protein